MQARSRARASDAAACADTAAGDVDESDDGQVARRVHGGDGRADDAVLPGVDLEQAGAVRGGRRDEEHVGGGSVEHVVGLAVQFPAAADGAGVVSEFGRVPVAGRGGPGEGGDRGAVGDRGEQPLAGRLVAGGEHGLGGEDDGAEHGGGREVFAQFLHDDAGLGQPGAGAAVPLGDRESGDADFSAQPGPGGAAASVFAISLRTASRRSRCSTVRPIVAPRVLRPVTSPARPGPAGDARPGCPRPGRARGPWSATG